MKFVFMGTPDFAVGIFEELIDLGHKCVMAVTQPDRPKGRGHDVQFPPVKEAAIKRNVPVMQPANVSDTVCVEDLKDLGADVLWWQPLASCFQRKCWIYPDTDASMCMHPFCLSIEVHPLYNGLLSTGMR